MKQYSLQEIYEQAKQDHGSIQTTMSRGESIINIPKTNTKYFLMKDGNVGA